MTNSLINKQIVWIAWERHRRTVELCRYFGFYLIIYEGINNRLLKYIIFTLKTLIDILKLRPHVLIVQNPSIVLTFIACIFKNLFGYKLIVDTHNGGILPENKFLQRLSAVYKFFQKKADVTIVTNINLANIVSRNNGIPFVMPDKLPEVRNSKTSSDLGMRLKIVYICTFGSDEPYIQVIEAANHFSSNVSFLVTGNIKRVPITTVFSKPPNLTFTGFLPDDEYWGLLLSADLIIDLTYRDDCLVCGAYEAVAAKVPLVLSDTVALRDYFNKGVVFTNNSTEDLVIKITYAVDNIQRLKEEINCLNTQLRNEWNEVARNFTTLLKGI
jgi:glycosyltransferase involved in cell wall biosynthesis